LVWCSGADKANTKMETYFNNLTTNDGGRKQLLQDIRKLIEEAEGLIKNTAEDLPEKSKSEILERLERLKKSCHRIDEQTYAGVEAVDQMVRRYPYQSIGIAALGGVILGTILNKK
jgi:ElaB/YqjD/DUF883 family membrane-anchored ribosome-binding protein